MKTLKLNSTFRGLVVVLALASFAVAMPVGAAPLNAGGNAIAVHAQDANSGVIMVDSVTATQAGWLLIWKDVNGAPGSLLGFAAVHQGVNTGVAVDIKTTDRNGDDAVTPTLWATLASDPNADYPLASPDPTIMPSDSVLTVGFASSAAAGAASAVASAITVPTTGGVSSSPIAPKQNQISVHRQDTNTGVVMVDSVTATQDGWVLIWKDANGAPSSLLGFTAVHQGVNTGVAVDLKTADHNGNDDITPTLWATFMPDPNATTPFAVPDPLTAPGSSVLRVTFGSTAD
jgi:hypothetical protein